jgi:glycosyltransferase involved in cell wall biosynthesis
VAVAPPRSPRAAGSPITFGFIGRLEIDKGIRTLVRAFAQADIGDARLVVAGQGSEAATVSRAPGIDYRGWVSGMEKESLLDEFDCLVVPSQYEDPAPLAVNEARSHGLPVIGSTAGGIPELIAPECTALLVPPADATALARAMERFVAAPESFAPVAAGRPLDWDGHLRAIDAAYRDALDAATATERGGEKVVRGLPLTDGRGSFSSTSRG